MDLERREMFNQLYNGTGGLIHDLCEDPVHQEGTAHFLDTFGHLCCHLPVFFFFFT